MKEHTSKFKTGRSRSLEQLDVSKKPLVIGLQCILRLEWPYNQYKLLTLSQDRCSFTCSVYAFCNNKISANKKNNKYV